MASMSRGELKLLGPESLPSLKLLGPESLPSPVWMELTLCLLEAIISTLERFTRFKPIDCGGGFVLSIGVGDVGDW